MNGSSHTPRAAFQGETTSITYAASIDRVGLTVGKMLPPRSAPTSRRCKECLAQRRSHNLHWPGLRFLGICRCLRCQDKSAPRQSPASHAAPSNWNPKLASAAEERQPIYSGRRVLRQTHPSPKPVRVGQCGSVGPSGTCPPNIQIIRSKRARRGETNMRVIVSSGQTLL